MLDGIDVSAYQDVTPPLDGLAFCIVKASEGNGGDPRYARHASAVRSHHGMGLGAYHFGRLEWGVPQQVDAFLRNASGADFWALDVERSPQSGTIMSEQQGRAFIDVLKHQLPRRKVLLYGSVSPGAPPDGPWARFPADCWGADAGWVAWPEPTPPPVPWLFWQYGGTTIDLDYFGGDQAALDAWLGRVTTGGVVSMTNREGYPKPLAVADQDPFYARAGDASPVGRFSGPATVQVQGRVLSPGGGWYEAWVDTGAGYADGLKRASGVYLHLQEPVTWAVPAGVVSSPTVVQTQTP